MTAEESLYAVLSAAAGVAALVGTRIYPDLAPQTASVPCIAFVRESTEFVTTIHANEVVGETANLSIVCIAESRKAADQVADAVQNACIAAGIYPAGRRADLDPETDTWATVLSVNRSA